MKILIVEDNPVYVALLKNRLQQTSVPHEIVGVSENVKDAYTAIQTYTPDVLILDVDLGKESSFELLEQINYKDYEIIFATAHDQFAISAFDVEAIGYLVKPVIASQLEKFLRIAQTNLLSKNRHVDERPVAVKDQHIVQATISIPSEAGFDIVPVASILRCEAVNASTQIFLMQGKKMVSSYNIGKFYSLLSDKGFYQVHRSHIINLAHVKRYLRQGSVIMQDDTEIPISKNNRQDFISIFSIVDKQR